MLENLKEQAPDKIIELIGLYAADTRANKLDLGVGVYKDAEGNTPVMRAVKAAEAQLLAEQDSKKYVGLLGDFLAMSMRSVIWCWGIAWRLVVYAVHKSRAVRAPFGSCLS